MLLCQETDNDRGMRTGGNLECQEVTVLRGGKPCRYLGAVGIVCAKVLRQECVEVSEQ